MKKLLVVAVVVIIAGNRSHSHDPLCKSWPPTPQTITVENVREICALGANPGRIIEARWHKTKPILVQLVLTSKRAAEASTPAISVWDVERNITIDEGEDLIGRNFTQLELTSSSIIVGTNAGSIKSWELMHQELQYELSITDGEVTELLLYPTDEWLLVVIDYSRLFKVDTKYQTVTEIHLQDNMDFSFQSVAFSNDGRLLAVAGAGAMGIWDTTDWVARDKVSLSSDVPVSLHFTKSNSDLVLLAGKSVSHWSFAGDNLEFVQTLKRHEHLPQCMFLGGDMNPDGNLLMTTDKCGQLRAWHLELNYEIGIREMMRHVAEEHIGVPTRFSPDGRFLVERVDDWGFALLIVPDDENTH